MRRVVRRASLALLAAAVALAVSACGAGAEGGPRILFSGFGEGMTQPVGVQLTGLEPGHPVVVDARARTAGGTLSSRAVYAVGPNGRVRLWSQEPLSAPYPRPDGSGLLWSMTGPSLSQQQLESQWVFHGLDVRYTAQQDGRPVASEVLHRVALAAGTRGAARPNGASA